MTARWWPPRDPEPGPLVRAVAIEGEHPRRLRWERGPAGWSTRGSYAAYPRHTPARPWREIGAGVVERLRCPRCGDECGRALIDVTAQLGQQCTGCDGYGCTGCGWSGRRDWTTPDARLSSRAAVSGR